MFHKICFPIMCITRLFVSKTFPEIIDMRNVNFFLNEPHNFSSKSGTKKRFQEMNFKTFSKKRISWLIFCFRAKFLSFVFIYGKF